MLLAYVSLPLPLMHRKSSEALNETGQASAANAFRSLAASLGVNQRLWDGFPWVA